MLVESGATNWLANSSAHFEPLLSKLKAVASMTDKMRKELVNSASAKPE
jgi:hypothetical protein